jgi:hypothetical protein
MISRRRYRLVSAIYPSSRGFAFVLFESSLAPVDWGVHEARVADKNAHCLKRVTSLFELHTPDVLVLQDMSEQGTRRAPRIRELNYKVAEQAETFGMLIRFYSRAQIRERFLQDGATTKSAIAEMIVKHVPALKLYVPPARKLWMKEHPHMGIFDAAALALMFFQTSDAGQTVP